MTADLPPRIAIYFDHPRWRDVAEQWSQQLGLPIAKKFSDPHDLHLAVTDADDDYRLELRVVDAEHPLRGGRGVAADWSQLDTQSGPGRSLKSPLCRAAGLKHGRRPTVCDATAGLGEDTWLLAAAGCRVTALERQPVVHALLTDALRRAQHFAPDVADRITLPPCVDAADWLTSLADPTRIIEPPPTARPFDVVMLDPMFPGHAKRKTAERKPMRILRLLAGEDADADRLWPAAYAAASRRVIVKRPAPPPPLAGQTPAVTHAGKGLRFDVYPVS